MNPHWTLTRSGTWWIIHSPIGQWEAAYPPGQWQAAMAHAHIAASRQRIRDAKHRELLPARFALDKLRHIIALMDGTAEPRQADYALAH